MPDQACETGTAPTASDKSAKGAADVRKHGWSEAWRGGAANSIKGQSREYNDK